MIDIPYISLILSFDSIVATIKAVTKGKKDAVVEVMLQGCKHFLLELHQLTG